MADQVRCRAGEHDYLPPVVVRHERRQLSWFFVVFGDSSRGVYESAVTFCRRCGRMLAYGWQPSDATDDDEASTDG